MAEIMAKNIAIGKEKKDAGDVAFKAGDVKAALRSYYEALLYLKGVDKTQSPAFNDASRGIGGGSEVDPSGGSTDPPLKPKTENEILIEKIYSNMSACHMKQENWQRGLECADKAIALNETNYKAVFRKGKALGELGYIEKCEKLFEELLKKTPEDTAVINAELERQRARDKERERKHNKKMRGFLSRDRTLLDQGEPSEAMAALTVNSELS